jgi:hypothetical protein
MSVHEIQVSVVSPEEGSCSMAELWSGGQVIGLTHIADGELVLRIEPRNDGVAVELGAQRLADALAEASRLLAA